MNDRNVTTVLAAALVALAAGAVACVIVALLAADVLG